MKWIGYIGAAIMLAFPVTAQAQDSPDAAEPAPWIIRLPPAMPPTANRSGYCCMQIKNGEDNRASLTSISCSESVFEVPTREAVDAWRFIPGAAMAEDAKLTPIDQIMSFALVDSAGRCINDIGGVMCKPEGGFAKVRYEDVCHADRVS